MTSWMATKAEYNTLCIFNEISLCKYENASTSISNIWTKAKLEIRKWLWEIARSVIDWLVREIDSTQLCQSQLLLYACA